MNILAFDTCSSGCSAAVLHGSEVTSSIKENRQHMQAELIVLMVEEAMNASNMVYTELDAIGVTIGPGSFTGVKIGITVAYAISSAISIPIIGISTLELLAYAFFYHSKDANNANHEITTTLSAGKGRFYCQKFKKITPLTPAYLLEEQQVQEFSKSGMIIGEYNRTLNLDAFFLAKFSKHKLEKLQDYDITHLPKPIYNLPNWL